MAFDLHYTGVGYPTRTEIEEQARKEGFTHSFWASDDMCGFHGMYNGDTIVVYNSTEGMSEGMKHDAEEYGQPILPIEDKLKESFEAEDKEWRTMEERMSE